MPTPYIEKLAKQGKGTVTHLEEEWNKAKEDAKKEGKEDNYGYITSIFKNRVGASTIEMTKLFGSRWTGQGAGIMFINEDKEILWLKRGLEGDHPGEWCWPGGGVDPGENPKQAAIRECKEEIGYTVNTHRVHGEHPFLFDRLRHEDGFVFYTFVCKSKDRFIPTLNNEHTDWIWLDQEELPNNPHPGCVKTHNEWMKILEKIKSRS